MFTKAEVKAGDHVLIPGIGGGVALFALQFAVAAGAHVYVTSSSPDKIKRAVAMGAVGGVNYKDRKWKRLWRVFNTEISLFFFSFLFSLE